MSQHHLSPFVGTSYVRQTSSEYRCDSLQDTSEWYATSEEFTFFENQIMRWIGSKHHAFERTCPTNEESADDNEYKKEANGKPLML